MWTGLGGLGEKILNLPFLKMSDPSDINLRICLLHYTEKTEPTSLSSSASVPAVQVFGVSGEEAENFCSDKERYLGVFAESRAQI